MSEFQERLSRMGEAWKQGKAAAAGPANGIYNMQLQNVILKESSAGKLGTSWEHLITEGEYAGEVVRDFIGIENEFGPRMLSQRIEILGYTSPDDPAELEGVLAAILNDAPHYTGQVKKAKDSDFRNVNIRQLVEGGAETPAPKAAAKASAPAKAAPKALKKAAPEPAAEGLNVGDAVEYNNGEAVFTGKLLEVKDDGNAVFETESGEAYEVAYADLTTPTAVEETTDEPAEEAKDTAELLALCQAHNIACAEDDTHEALVENIGKYEWTKDELSPEEYKLLKSIGATVKEPAAKKAAAVTKPAPAKKAAPAPAKKAPAKAPAKAAKKK